MTEKAVRPEDLLPDNQNTVNLDGIIGRKGSIAAFLKNIDLLENPSSSPEQQTNALAAMKELAPVLIATGLHRHAVFKNPLVQRLLDEEARPAQERCRS